jgi:hypothetical protein
MHRSSSHRMTTEHVVKIINTFKIKTWQSRAFTARTTCPSRFGDQHTLALLIAGSVKQVKTWLLFI